MSTKENLLQAHHAMCAVLDEKFKNAAEWKAFRAIDKALLELVEPPVSTIPKAGSIRQSKSPFESYVELGIEAITEFGEPMPTPKMIEFIAARREIPNDPAKAKVNISTSFSKDKRFKNIPWSGGRAWWLANRELPKKAAGLSANS